ncbi:hypothetical protein EUGRSUZ_E01280 [Eucalyptus grandis]|uniref:Uncharacterized protein n=2 Tax=Eucalyptus grandis TaxID=71139 RepID=A0ACC3KTU4_EUCGR|nr:hypothetical protein EUGRSUZ_E01280 [Eucalyptus grandis]
MHLGVHSSPNLKNATTPNLLQQTRKSLLLVVCFNSKRNSRIIQNAHYFKDDESALRNLNGADDKKASVDKHSILFRKEANVAEFAIATTQYKLTQMRNTDPLPDCCTMEKNSCVHIKPSCQVNTNQYKNLLHHTFSFTDPFLL